MDSRKVASTASPYLLNVVAVGGCYVWSSGLFMSFFAVGLASDAREAGNSGFKFKTAYFLG